MVINFSDSGKDISSTPLGTLLSGIECCNILLLELDQLPHKFSQIVFPDILAETNNMSQLKPKLQAIKVATLHFFSWPFQELEDKGESDQASKLVKEKFFMSNRKKYALLCNLPENGKVMVSIDHALENVQKEQQKIQVLLIVYPLRVQQLVSKAVNHTSFFIQKLEVTST